MELLRRVGLAIFLLLIGLTSAVPAIGAVETPILVKVSYIDTDKVLIEWEVDDVTITGFRIERSLGDDLSFTLVEEMGPATSYVDRGVPIGTNLYYRVMAMTATETSALSNHLLAIDDGFWSPIASINLGRLAAITFTHEGKGYLGTGIGNTGLLKDLWVYDPTSGSWTQLADIGDQERYNGSAMVLNGQAYVGLGFGNSANTALADLWRYNFADNQWSQLEDFPGGGRSRASAFSVGSRGYIGMGDIDFSNQDDLWRFDPGTEEWTQVSDFGGGSRSAATTFTIDGTVYVGGIGFNQDGLWRYDEVNDNWTELNYPDVLIQGGAAGFNIGSKGYAFAQDALWEYDPAQNSWRRKADFPQGSRSVPNAFSLGENGYAGLGSISGLSDDVFWKYSNEGYLAAPRGLEVLEVINNQATLHWEDLASNETGYFVEVSVNKPDSWSPAGQLGANVTSFVSSHLDDNTTYFWRVSTLGAGGAKSVPSEFVLANPGPNWKVTADNPGDYRQWGVAFSTGDKAYYGLGIKIIVRETNEVLKDFWQYDPEMDSWTQKASHAGGGRYSSSVFVLNEKGYVSGGLLTDSDFQKTAEVWSYDPASNQWSQHGDFPGTSRHQATAFAYEEKGYLAFGDTDLNGEGNSKDFWQYDPVSDNWVRLNDFAGEPRRNASAFVVADRVFIGIGDRKGSEPGIPNDFYEYFPQTDEWEPRAEFIGNNEGVGFVLEEIIYFFECCSGSQIFYSYDTEIDQWSSLGTFPGTSIPNSAYSLGDFGYVGFGTFPNITTEQWRYAPRPLPRPLQLSLRENATIAVSWETKASDLEYALERSFGSLAFERIATLQQGESLYLDESLTPGTRYSYTIDVTAESGNSGFSNSVFIDMPPLPEAPTITRAELINRGVMLEWEDNSHDEIRFVVGKSVGDASFEDLELTEPGVTSYFDPSLGEGSAFRYIVWAENYAGRSLESESSQVGIITGLKENSPESLVDEVSIYPNPSEGIVHLEFPWEGQIKVEVYNYVGMKVLGITRAELHHNHYQLDLTSYQGGFYLVKVITPQKVINKKLLLL